MQSLGCEWGLSGLGAFQESASSSTAPGAGVQMFGGVPMTPEVARAFWGAPPGWNQVSGQGVNRGVSL